MEVSYYEIYMEKINDLLSKKEDLKIRQHPTYGPFVTDLTKILVTDNLMIQRLIDKGNIVTIYDNLSSGKKQYIEQHLENDNVTFIKADLLNSKLTEFSPNTK